LPASVFGGWTPVALSAAAAERQTRSGVGEHTAVSRRR
jgi:hypothetical protein